MHALQLHRGPCAPDQEAVDHDALDHEVLGQFALDNPIDSHVLLGSGVDEPKNDVEPRAEKLLREGDSAGNFLDMATLRQRVASIKNRWSPETVRARAIEGARRRVELEGLVASLADLDADERFGENGEFRLFL